MSDWIEVNPCNYFLREKTRGCIWCGSVFIIRITRAKGKRKPLRTKTAYHYTLDIDFETVERLWNEIERCDSKDSCLMMIDVIVEKKCKLDFKRIRTCSLHSTAALWNEVKDSFERWESLQMLYYSWIFFNALIILNEKQWERNWRKCK